MLCSKRILGFGVLLCALALYILLPFPEESRRALVLFFIAALFWAFEMIPLFATSIGLVACLTLFLTKPESFTLYFSQFANPIIFLFLGGFVLAKALRKHQIDSWIAGALFNWIGTKPFALLCGHLFLTAFLSMWMSNTASTAIILALIAPLLKRMPSNDPLQKGLPLAVAFGASIGGIATPIGTPPNALAIGILAEHGVEVSFLNWMLMALPLSLIILVIASIVLWLFFSSNIKIAKPRQEKQQLSLKAMAVIVGMCVMIFLWLTKPLHHIPESLVALMGTFYFAAFKLIDINDLKQIEWDVLFLMWGGLALGEAMIASNVVSILFGPKLFGMEFWLLVGCFCLLALGLSSFMSNTAAANLLLPLIVSFSSENNILLIITIALSCSLAISFPISTPPNALAYSLQTFKTKDMFKSGIVISLLALVIILLGFDVIIPKFFF